MLTRIHYYVFHNGTVLIVVVRKEAAFYLTPWKLIRIILQNLLSFSLTFTLFLFISLTIYIILSRFSTYFFVHRFLFPSGVIAFSGSNFFFCYTSFFLRRFPLYSTLNFIFAICNVVFSFIQFSWLALNFIM